MNEEQTTNERLQAENGHLRAILDGVNVVVFAKDLQGRYTYVNRQLATLLGLPPGEVLGKDDSQLVDAATCQACRKSDERVLFSGEVVAGEEMMVSLATGARRFYWTVKKPLRDARGEIEGLYGSAIDVTERWRGETPSTDHEALLSAVLDSIDAHVYVKDAEGRFLYVNHSVAELFGRSVDEIVGAFDREILPDDVLAEQLGLDRRVFKTGQRQSGEESFTGPDGRRRRYLAVKMPWRLAAGRDVLVGFNTDITDRYELRLRLERLVVTDELTSIANRRGFYECARREFSRARRHSLPLGLVAIDLDFFKRVNDEFGHPAGDEVLRAAVKCLQGGLRQEDFIARTGGEEFAVLLPDTDVQGAQEVAQRLCGSLVDCCVLGVQAALRVTASFGVSGMQPDDANFDALYVRADRALYRAKEQGRNRVVAGGS